MYKNNNCDLYFIHKHLLYIIFDDDREVYKNLIDGISNINVLYELSNLTKFYANQGLFSDNIKGNIFTILNDLREVKDEYTKERISIINNIIVTLNSSPDKSLLFYANQIYLRTDNKRVLKHYNVDDIEYEKSFIHKSIMNDFLVLLSHSENVSEETFERLYLPAFINSDLYYESLNIILKECKSLFNDKLFMSRVQKITTCNLGKDEYYKILNKKLNNKIKKLKFKY